MITAHVATTTDRVGSLVLLAGGVLLVFAGLTTALGVSTAGVIASAAAIAALLYAGGVWFGASAPADASVVLFTPQLIVAAGPLAGRPLTDLYPSAARDAIVSHCRAAMAGESSRFSLSAEPAGPAGLAFDAAPILRRRRHHRLRHPDCRRRYARAGHRRMTSPSATTSSAKQCATVSGPSTRTLTRTNSSRKRNAPAITK